MDKTLLKELTSKLLAEKERLASELGKFAKPSGESGDYNTQWEEYGDDEDENAAEVAAYTDSLGLEQTFESELAEVNEALKRIDEGTYGICFSCGKEIEEERLKARPQSALCMACMEKK